MKAFNDLADFSIAEIRELITLARRLQEKPEPRALEGKSAFAVISKPIITYAHFLPVRNGALGRQYLCRVTGNVHPRH
jgi:hypothetical protein